MRFSGLPVAITLLVLGACNTRAPEGSVHPEPKASAAPVASARPNTGALPNELQGTGALRLGAPIEASATQASLTEVAKNPSAFLGKTFATTGTVTAVCQHMGCWMEIKDESGAAHIKMAGHSFFVPKTASGRKARVLATLVKNEEEAACGDDGDGKMAAAGGPEKHAKGKGCKAEAEAQLGRPLAKLELVAEGVELL